MLGRKAFHFHMASRADDARKIGECQIFCNREVMGTSMLSSRRLLARLRTCIASHAEIAILAPKAHVGSFHLPVATQAAALVGAAGVATKKSGELGVLVSKQQVEVTEVLEASAGQARSQGFCSDPRHWRLLVNGPGCESVASCS